MHIIIVTSRGVAHILTADEHLMFIRVRIEGGSIRRIDGIYRPIQVDENIAKKIREIDDSVARES